MEMVSAKSWKLEFARSTEAERYREITRRHHDELRRRKDKDEKKREDRADDLADLAFVVMASEADIRRRPPGL